MLDFVVLKKLYFDFQPDVVIHTAAVVDQDANKVKISNIQGTKNIIKIAKINNTPIIFSSSESVYGGKEQTGEYKETDPYKPRSAYGETKVESEKIVMTSGLNYLITRCHRYVGINKNFHKPKQFPDTIKALTRNQTVHLDAHRLFKPCLINHLAEVFAYYIEHDSDKKILLNIGVDKAMTYYDFIIDVTKTLDLKQELIKSDYEEITWPENSTLSLHKIKELGYPTLSYQKLLETLKHDWRNND
jgi:dTDP-4-dehydrorhamnose reductase